MAMVVRGGQDRHVIVSARQVSHWSVSVCNGCWQYTTAVHSESVHTLSHVDCRNISNRQFHDVLHWLLLPYWVQFRDCNTLRHTGPAYFQHVSIQTVSFWPCRSQLRRTRWNCRTVSHHLSCSRFISTGQCRCGLQTRLFQQAYNLREPRA